jgi:hypothetical protein
VIALITPTQAAIETSTPAATAINGDETATPASDLANEKASLAAHVVHKPVEQAKVVAQVKSHANCLSNSVGGPVDGVQSLAVNLALVLGSVLPGVLLFYGALCAVYMLRQRSERKKRQKIKW